MGAGPCCSVPFKTLLFALVSSVIPNLLPAFPLCAPYSNTPLPPQHPQKASRNNLSGANYLTFEEGGGGILKKKVIRAFPSSVHVQWAGQKTSDWEALNFRIFHERIPPDPFR